MKKRPVLVVFALLILAAAAAFLSSRRTPRPAADEFAFDSASDAPSSPSSESELRGVGAARTADGSVEVLEERIALDATLSVRVLEAATRRAVSGARVRATIDFRWTRDRPTGLDFEREVVSGSDGIARFEAFPRRTGVEIRVHADGFRVGATKVTVGKDEGERELEVALKPGLSREQSSVLVGLPDGVSLPGAFVLYDDATRRFHDRIPVGGYVPIEDDPAAAVVEHDLALQLILPGYAGPVQRRSFRRGTRLALDPPGRPVVQEVVLLDELGRGIEGVDVKVWPLEAIYVRARGSAAYGTTDARGVCRIDGYVGSRWDLALDETKVHATERLYEQPVVVGSGPRTIRCLRRAEARLRLDAPGITAAKGVCGLDWRSFEPVPGSPVDRLFRADEAFRERTIEAYRADLPSQITWERDASGVAWASIGLVPGSYLLAPSIAGVVGRPTTIDVPVGGGETVVAFAATRKVTVQVTGSIDRADGPLPFGAIVAPRRVGWDERVTLTKQIEPQWRRVLDAPPRRGDRDDLARFREFAGRAISTARTYDPVIGPDLVWSGFDGIAELDVSDEPTELTVLFPGHLATVVPLEPGSPHLRARVGPSMFRTLDVRLRRTSGEPFGGYRVCVDSVDRLRHARAVLAGQVTAGESGAFRLGYLPGESLGLNPWNDAWTLTPDGGATIERLSVGYNPTFVLTMPTGGAPSLSIVVEPHAKPK